MAWELPVLSWSIQATRFYSGSSATNCCFKNKERFTRENLFSYINSWNLVCMCPVKSKDFKHRVITGTFWVKYRIAEACVGGNVDFPSSNGSIILIEKCQGKNKLHPKPMWAVYRLIWYTQRQRGLRLSSPPSDTVFIWKLPTQPKALWQHNCLLQQK